MLQTAQLSRSRVYNDNFNHNEADSDIKGSPKSQGIYSSDEAESSTARIVRGTGSGRGITKGGN
ncbi:2586_t:CDS:2 [Funneliformis caledonium]|uniref:2586_t:CDS:1 n=1 Tax=Funneliformis caledonium TaxID=1117310 RepID=A0A9N8WD78_9GLOM|nr:2586_t:CDS:2 [Funneliformis caledonium]